ncbi:TPA: YIP1 family protein [Candidatus Bipolaricaulota bacterium]|nr:YIP1 family protein [Candidatus Bipolaricaulota bacterium]
MIDKMIRAARLDISLYEEVERDEAVTTEAMMVVVLVSLLSGLGSGLAALVSGQRGFVGLIVGLIVGAIAALIGWAIMAVLTYVIGTSVFGGTATIGEMLRTLGYAYTPNVLGALSFIPCLGPLLALVGFLWHLVAIVVAVRQALDFDTTKAVLTCIIGWVVGMIVFAVIAATVGGGLALLGALTGAVGR